MDNFNIRLKKFIALLVIVAPITHTITDIWELYISGYSTTLLLVNYIAFIVLPFAIMGLFAVQRPHIKMLGLVGAFLYAYSFIYFSHTALYALEEQIPNYEILWQELGLVYTFHGGVMVVGGLLFGFVTYKLNILPRWASICFLIGVSSNLLFALIEVREISQIFGSALRNIGLAGMGYSIFYSSNSK